MFFILVLWDKVYNYNWLMFFDLEMFYNFFCGYLSWVLCSRDVCGREIIFVVLWCYVFMKYKLLILVIFVLFKWNII